MQLSLESFVNFENIMEKQNFKSKDVFDYLGKNLAHWLANLLTTKTVQDRALIHPNAKISPQAIIEGVVWIDEDVVVEPFAYIQGPTYIARGAEIRHGAYIRGNVYVGPKAVVGHTTEVKGSILFDHAKASHFAYLGDSILGSHVNLGAGTKLANLKLKNDEVFFIHPETKKKTASGLRKFGAVIGDGVQTGCNSVLSPGTIVLPQQKVMPCQHVFGILGEIKK